MPCKVGGEGWGCGQTPKKFKQRRRKNIHGHTSHGKEIGGQTYEFKLWRTFGGDRHMNVNCDGHLTHKGGQTYEFKLWRTLNLSYYLDIYLFIFQIRYNSLWLPFFNAPCNCVSYLNVFYLLVLFESSLSFFYNFAFSILLCTVMSFQCAIIMIIWCLRHLEDIIRVITDNRIKKKWQY